MLDYAVTQNQKHGLSKLTLICLTTSFFAHFLFFLGLIQFPQLLEAGYYHQFRGIQRNVREEDDTTWRTVAILESPKKMVLPSPDTLKKYLSQEKKGSGVPPIRVNLGNLAEALAKLPPLPQSPQKDKEPPLPPPSNTTTPAVPEADPLPQAKNQGNGPKDSEDKGAGIPISTQKPGVQPEVAVVNTAPTKIPDSIKPPVTNEEPKTSQSSGIELSDTKGFPMGDYQDIISERIYTHWFIPSNMKNSQGRTTVTFKIDKEGRCTDLHIAKSSGYKSLDLAALSAITESIPFPLLPKGFPGDRISVKFHMIVKP
jgi:periplasmic protein TonB